jgi:hypothetical protein
LTIETTMSFTRALRDLATQIADGQQRKLPDD